MPQTLLYAHGFKSSSQSRKARQLARVMQEDFPQHRFICPDLAFRPREAMAQLRSCCDGVPADSLSVIGSSLGGFYAIALAEKFGCRAVLLNPSIKPYETLRRYLGEQENMYTREKFHFDESHIAELESMRVASISRPERYLLIVEMGDELLDHRQTISYLDGAQRIVIDGGDHELKSFPAHIPAAAKFCNL